MSDGKKGPVTYVYRNAEESQYLFSAKPIPDLALGALLPSIPVKHLQNPVLGRKLPNGWFKHSEAMLDFMVDTVRFILEVFEEHPPTECLAALDDLLKGKGICR